VIFLFLVLATVDAGGRELASGSGSATWAAERPVRFAVRSYAADIEVVASPTGSLTVSAPGRVRLVSSGADRVEAEFGGKRQLHDGKIRIALPRGSALDAGAVSGSVSVAGVGGEARVRGMSGRVRVAGATDVDVETVDGAVEIDGATGVIRVHTVSGGTVVSAPRTASRLELETASGPVDFRGGCGAGCHIDVDSVSGDVVFALDAKSSATARVVSTSGKVRDDRGFSLQRRPGGSEGDFSEGAIARGDGLIECETFSGNITFARPGSEGAQ
jgi:DUF4097 and DUF4098 domain-containing protein YvlB